MSKYKNGSEKYSYTPTMNDTDNRNTGSSYLRMWLRAGLIKRLPNNYSDRTPKPQYEWIK